MVGLRSRIFPGFVRVSSFAFGLSALQIEVKLSIGFRSEVLCSFGQVLMFALSGAAWARAGLGRETAGWGWAGRTGLSCTGLAGLGCLG